MELNRKQFIQSPGATFEKWRWSFITHGLQIVIFGAWDSEREQARAVILGEEWELSARNKRLPGYTQAIEHLSYLNEGNDLYTFNMILSPKPDNPDAAVITGFEHRIEKRYLRKEWHVWYADTIGHAHLEELSMPEQYTEGARQGIPSMPTRGVLKPGKPVSGIMVPSARTADSISKNPAETWARTSSTCIAPLKTIGESYKIDPIRNRVPLYPNCHSMVHTANESRPLSVEALHLIIDEAKKQANTTGPLSLHICKGCLSIEKHG
ncbi:HNH endonuclease [Enterobacter hormaechei]